jgi:hypothetical protein
MEILDYGGFDIRLQTFLVKLFVQPQNMLQ